MTQALKELGDYVAAALPQDVTATAIHHGELIVTVKREAIARVLSFLRDDPKCLFKLLSDLCGEQGVRVKHVDRISAFSSASLQQVCCDGGTFYTGERWHDDQCVPAAEDTHPIARGDTRLMCHGTATLSLAT